MKGELQLMFTKIKFHRLVAACRYSSTPLACQRHWIQSYRQTEPGVNLTGIDDDYYDYPGADQYYFPLTSEEVFISYLYIIAFPYFLFFGTLGNMVGMTIMRKYSHNIWSTCLYMAILFPLDLIKLYVECGNDWYKKIHDRSSLSDYILKLSNAVCKVYSFTYSFLLHETEWLVVALSIEMLIAIRYPLRIYGMCTRDRGSAIVLFISVILISLNLHFFWTLGLTTPANDSNINITDCLYINELSDQFRDYIWPNIDFFVKHFAPFCVIVFCFVFAIPQISRNNNNHPEQNRRLGQYFLDIKTLHQLRNAMFVVSLIATLTITCEMLQTGLRYVSVNNLIDLEYGKLQLALGILATSIYFFISHKFWIFYVFCDRFRDDVRKLVKLLCRPLMRKYYKNSAAKTCVLLDKTQDPTGESWHNNDDSDSNNTGQGRS